MSDFYTYWNETEEEVEECARRLADARRQGPSVAWNEYAIFVIHEELHTAIHEALEIEFDKGSGLHLDLPPAHIKADFAMAMFPLASTLGTSPSELADTVAKYIGASDKFRYLASAESIQGYLNIHLNQQPVYQSVLQQVLMLGANYGCNPEFEDERIFIEYSSPNIAKPMSIGHLRSTIIGEVLARLYERSGAHVIRDNHIGDWGTQFGALLYAYQESDLDVDTSDDPIEELKNLYVSFTERAEKDPELQERARETFKRLEEKDPDLIAMWQHIREVSIREFEGVYDRLDIMFDLIVGESYHEPQAAYIIEDAEKQGIAHRADNGALVVDGLEQFDTFLMQKGDGTTLYLTRDVAALAYREGLFAPHRILYVVGNEQSLHFQQVFALTRALELIGNLHVEHVGFGLVRAGGKKMSTRKGRLVTLSDVLDEAVARAERIVKNKRPELEESQQQDIARKVGQGAVLYHNLRHVRTKEIDFDWDQMLSLEGESATYLQYTIARIYSMLEQIEDTQRAMNMEAPELRFDSDIEFQIAKHLSMYPWMLWHAVHQHAPHVLCTHLEQLASLFNTLYGQISIKNTYDEDLKRSRIVLISAVVQVLENGLEILNVPVPEKL